MVKKDNLLKIALAISILALPSCKNISEGRNNISGLIPYASKGFNKEYLSKENKSEGNMLKYKF